MSTSCGSGLIFNQTIPAPFVVVTGMAAIFGETGWNLITSKNQNRIAS